MIRSKVALTMLLGTLAVALQTVGRAHVPAGSPLPAGYRFDPCAQLWSEDSPHPEDAAVNYPIAYPYHGADCFHGRCGASVAASQTREEPAPPIDEYEYGYQTGEDCDCYPETVSPPVAGDVAELAANPAHSSGLDLVLRINQENDGLEDEHQQYVDYEYLDYEYDEEYPAVGNRYGDEGEMDYDRRAGNATVPAGDDEDENEYSYDPDRSYDESDNYGYETASHPLDLPPAESALVCKPSAEDNSPAAADQGYGCGYRDGCQSYDHCPSDRCHEAQRPEKYDYDAYDYDAYDYEAYDYEDEYRRSERDASKAGGPAGSPDAARESSDWECEWGTVPAPARLEHDTIRPMLRSAAWMLGELGETLIDLSRSVGALARPSATVPTPPVHELWSGETGPAAESNSYLGL